MTNYEICLYEPAAIAPSSLFSIKMDTSCIDGFAAVSVVHYRISNYLRAFVLVLIRGQAQQAVGVDEVLAGTREGVATTELLVRAGGGRMRAK